MMSLHGDLWRYRGFVLSSIGNELRSRFARSRLGGLWMIINPLAQVAIYALILSNVLAARLPGVEGRYAYAVYLIAGILAWSLFAEIVGRCLNLFIEQGNLMKKMRFPRITLPAIAVGSSLLNNLLLFAAAACVLLALGQWPGLLLLWLVPLTLITVALAVGIGLVVGILNVFVRDVGQVVPIGLQILFWFTPIVWPIEIVPEVLRALVGYSPLYAIVNGYHAVLVYQTAPNVAALIMPAIVGLGFMLLGLHLFRRAAPEMVDAL